MGDLTGQKFGRWTVQERAPRPPEQRHSTPRWRCECDCGVLRDVFQTSLRSGASQSCGCLRDEVATARGPEAGKRLIGAKGNLRHGGSGTHEWRIWVDMRRRCLNPKRPCFKDYGGRGIRVCERWSDFANFLADMGLAPSPLHTLDRENNDGHYEPGNCKWATRKEQARNRRSSLRFTAHGKTLTIAEWAEITGIGRTTIEARIHRGWTEPDRVLAPV